MNNKKVGRPYLTEEEKIRSRERRKKYQAEYQYKLYHNNEDFRETKKRECLSRHDKLKRT